VRRIQLQPAYLLHRRPFRDSSQLLEVFTLDHGRLSLVARGVSRRRRGGALGALLQPFRPLLLSFSGRGELATLTAAEAAGAYLPLAGERLYSALYLNELLSRLLHRHESHPALFSDYGLALEALGDVAALEPVLRRFELRLLDELGYAIDITRDADSGEPLQLNAAYEVDPELGLRTAVGQAASGRTRLLGADLAAIAAGELEGPVLASAKRLTRELLSPHLGPEPLRSRALFKQRPRAATGA
jgi:DNA repair protein RecO (recombination protein O)